jgi:hypothetical protein
MERITQIAEAMGGLRAATCRWWLPVVQVLNAEGAGLYRAGEAKFHPAIRPLAHCLVRLMPEYRRGGLGLVKKRRGGGEDITPFGAVAILEIETSQPALLEFVRGRMVVDPEGGEARGGGMLDC